MTTQTETIVWNKGEKPNKSGEYLVHDRWGNIRVDMYVVGSDWYMFKGENYRAWAELPTGWKEE